MRYYIDRLKKIGRMLDTHIDEELSLLQKAFIICDLGISVVIYGSGINDYFQYKFYKRRHIDKKTFIVYRKRMKIIKTMNAEIDRRIFDNKTTFNKTFSAYIKRNWLDMSTTSLEEFKNFCRCNNKFIVKPSDGSHGKGIRIESVKGKEKIKPLYNELKRENALIEEVITQHRELREFNPTSVNTIRVVTLLKNSEEVEIKTANFRMGNGERFADNFHHNGIASLLDVDRGIVITPGIDMMLNQFIIHPKSGKQIIGYQIPHWNEVVATVKEAAKVVPTVKYIGWDVVIGDDGNIIIIEGNAAADPDISQMPDQIGKWPLYKDVVLKN